MITRRDALLGLGAGSLHPFAGRALFAADAGTTRSAKLGAIRAVTFTASDLRAAEAAWSKSMGYRLIRRGRITRSTAHSWGTPAVAGQRYLVLGPASGEPTYLRFVEQLPSGRQPSTAIVGWTSAEITVQNSDELYARLKDSPFKVTRPPTLVPTYPYLKAMHAVGPVGEQLNLTWITEPRPDLAAAKSFVGRCYIAVLRAPDITAALRFYNDSFGNPPSPIRHLPALELATVALTDGSKIEVDHIGKGVPAHARPDGRLPEGLAMVTFECAALSEFVDRFVALPPAASRIEPFPGKRTGTMRGAAGELIELVEA